MKNVSRRNFLRTSATALAGFTIAPASIFGKSPTAASPPPGQAGSSCGNCRIC